MNACELLWRLRRDDIEVFSEGGNIIMRPAPDAETIKLVRAHKARLLDELEFERRLWLQPEAWRQLGGGSKKTFS